jgi:hypothetical protein
MVTSDKTAKQIILGAINKYKNLLHDSELSDIYVGDIPAKKINTARISHGIGIKEEILLLIDYTLWGGAANSLILTELGISIVLDEDDKDAPRYFIDWHKLIRVEYINEIFLFILDEDNEDFNIELEGNHLGIVLKSAKKLAPDIAEFFNTIASQFEDEEKILYEMALNSLNWEEKQFDEFFKLTDQFIKKFGEINIYTLDLFSQRAAAYADLQQIEKAKKEISYCFSLFQKIGIEFNEIPVHFFNIRSDIYKMANDLHISINDRARVIELQETKENKEIHEQILEELYESYKLNFVSLPYGQRKFVFTTDHYLSLANTTLNLLLIDKLPEINFPMGHPINDCVYVAHPFSINLYIPIEYYEVALFLDRVEEYCYILQCLGATKINVEWKNGVFINDTKNTISDKNGSLGLNFQNSVEITGGVRKEMIDNNSQTKVNRTSKVLEYTPTKVPYLPTKLLWYPKETSWQRLVEQRLNGNLSRYTEQISSASNIIVSSNEKKEIKAGLNLSIVEGRFLNEKSIESQLKEETSTEWQIHVEFAPLTDLGLSEKPTFITNEQANTKIDFIEIGASANEQLYIEEIKFTIEDDGIIDDGERKIIERKRLKYGISEQRAKVLEDLVMQRNKYSKEELAYIDELKFCLEDDGEISPSERRMLERTRIKLNISEARSNELEKTINKSN